MDMKQFKKGCLPGNLTEVESIPSGTLNEYRKKDLVQLMLELEDLKNDYKRIVEKKERLANLMKFYSGDIATEH